MTQQLQEWTTIKQAVRDKHAWPGGYAYVFIAGDGQMICHDCIKTNWREVVGATALAPEYGDREWQIVAVDVHWEGPAISCAHCNKPIPSEYGDPDTDGPGSQSWAERQGDNR